jgi:hypothetical protein
VAQISRCAGQYPSRVALASATAFVKTATTHTPRRCALIIARSIRKDILALLRSQFKSQNYALENGACQCALSQYLRLQHNPLDLIERNLIIATVIKLRRGRAFVRDHLLRILQKSAVEQTDGDAGVRNVWQPNLVMMPASRARRTIMRRGVLPCHAFQAELLAATPAQRPKQWPGLLRRGSARSMSPR